MESNNTAPGVYYCLPIEEVGILEPVRSHGRWLVDLLFCEGLPLVPHVICGTEEVWLVTDYPLSCCAEQHCAKYRKEMGHAPSETAIAGNAPAG
jgi:hypothetical protein